MFNIGENQMNNCDFVKIMTQIELKKMMKIWGIERTEEKIKWIYRSMPQLKTYLLREYNNILKGKI